MKNQLGKEKERTVKASSEKVRGSKRLVNFFFLRNNQKRDIFFKYLNTALIMILGLFLSCWTKPTKK